jgi:hypothetical protein
MRHMPTFAWLEDGAGRRKQRQPEPFYLRQGRRFFNRRAKQGLKRQWTQNRVHWKTQYSDALPGAVIQNALHDTAVGIAFIQS